MEAFPWSSGLEKKIRDAGHLKINPPPFFFRGLKVTGRPPSRSEICFQLKKASFFLQNHALIAILIVQGKDVVIRKACDELCHVVGSEKTRIRKYTHKKKQVSGAFPCVSGQILKHGSPFALRLQVLHGNALEFLSQI